jgi:peroxiredoxin Q/BCP
VSIAAAARGGVRGAPHGGAAHAADLAGARAPDFALAGSDGRTHRLADYVGKQGVVLAWFPKAFTPG